MTTREFLPPAPIPALRVPAVPTTAGQASADLAIVGAGIVGLAHAWHAVNEGRRVVVVERDERAVGSSIRNFGHACITAQEGHALEFGLAAREAWLRLAEETGLQVRTAGTVVAARSLNELAVLEEFAERRGDQVRLITAGETADRIGFDAPGLIGGAHLPLDLRFDAPSAMLALTEHLTRRGVRFRFDTTVTGVEGATVHTTRGDVVADQVIVAVNHDIDRMFPEIAARYDVLRCRLRMLEVETAIPLRVQPGVLTGLSLLRYAGFAHTDAAAAVREDIRASAPELLDEGVNLMMTQRPNGRLVLGDTHHYDVTEWPFEEEYSDELLLREFRRLLDIDDLPVRRRWRGVYASSDQTEFLVEPVSPSATIVTVTSGIGMTTAFGLAKAVLADRSAVPARPRQTVSTA